MACPHLLDGVHPFCRATLETLVAGLQDLSRCRSGYWVECSAVAYAGAVVEVRPTTGDLVVHDLDLDREAPGARPPPHTPRRGRDPHELPLSVARLLRARAGSG